MNYLLIPGYFDSLGLVLGSEETNEGQSQFFQGQKHFAIMTAIMFQSVCRSDSFSNL